MPPIHRNPGDPVEGLYNVAHKQTRRMIENSYGILKRRFMCLQTGLRTTPEWAAKIIVVCAALHNLATLHTYDETDNGELLYNNRQPTANEKLQEIWEHFERNV